VFCLNKIVFLNFIVLNASKFILLAKLWQIHAYCFLEAEFRGQPREQPSFT
jgi:hypothetical protein